MTILTWILVPLISFAFLFFSMVKIFGVPASVYNMQKESYFDVYGVNRTQIRLIGLAELFGGVTIWLWATPFQWVAQIGLATLIMVTIGAMYFHSRYDSLLDDGIGAVVQFGLSSAVLGLTLFFV